MKSRNKRILSWILLIAWMCLIFIMSNQPAEVSSKQSDFVIKIFNFLGLHLNDKLGDMATLIIRKGAHFTEYFVLYILIYRVITFYINKKSAIIFSILLVFLYACSDEIHQSFIPGRAMAFKDVLIDTSGGMVGLILMYSCNIFKSKMTKKAV